MIPYHMSQAPQFLYPPQPLQSLLSQPAELVLPTPWNVSLLLQQVTTILDNNTTLANLIQEEIQNPLQIDNAMHLITLQDITTFKLHLNLTNI